VSVHFTISDVNDSGDTSKDNGLSDGAAIEQSPQNENIPANDTALAPQRIPDPIDEIDEIIEHWTDRQRQIAETEENIQIEMEKFLESYGELSRSVIKPTMEVIVRRLEEDGGGGLIWDGHSEAMHRPRSILWMSLKGKITGTPRQDLNPYLQLDVDVEHRRIDVWEGDMWEREGTSRATSPWTLDEITSEIVTERVVAILERAAGHGQTFTPPPPK
jgi:hypothetical protein